VPNLCPSRSWRDVRQTPDDYLRQAKPDTVSMAPWTPRRHRRPHHRARDPHSAYSHFSEGAARPALTRPLILRAIRYRTISHGWALYGDFEVKLIRSSKTPLSKVSLFGRKGAVSSSWPARRVAPRAAAVNTGRRPSPKAARSGVDSREHSATLAQAGSAFAACSIAATGPRTNRGEPAMRREVSRPRPCIRLGPPGPGP